MILNLEIVRVDSDYCDYLRQFDNKVAYNKHEKELRPFIGILFEIDTCKYFAPLSSPKPKHRRMKNMIDFFKIKDGELGAVNFNNMIPVTDKNYTLVDLNKETLTIAELKYQKLLKEQLNWLLDGSKAVGIDNVNKKEYAENLDENIKDLVIRLKNKAYKPAPALRVYIPKDNGKMRPLGISIYEDKIVQLALKYVWF